LIDLRPLAVLIGLLLAWQALVWLTAVPPYLLPGPAAVGRTLVASAPLLLDHAGITLAEILLGLAGGVLVGGASALLMALLPPVQPWLLPVLILGQTIPVFALAPLLVLWLGYGIASKVAMAVLIIYFPVTAALFDGLQRTEPGCADRRGGRRVGRLLGRARLSDAARQCAPADRSDVRRARRAHGAGAGALFPGRSGPEPPHALGAARPRLEAILNPKGTDR
jgi:putative hydroxymethylpyrimidine transport system permease protein